MSNFNAIHFRWLDPLTQQIKETIALVSPAESAVNVLSFVRLASRPPNQLVMFAQPGAGASTALGSSKPSLGFTPGKSAVDRFRSKAVFVPGAAPAASATGSMLGQDILAGFGFGRGKEGKSQDTQTPQPSHAQGPGHTRVGPA